MQLCRLARTVWTDGIVPYGENIFSGIFFQRSGFAVVRGQKRGFFDGRSTPIEPLRRTRYEPFMKRSRGGENRFLTILATVIDPVQDVRSRTGQVKRSAEPDDFLLAQGGSA
jgi:hypothetical protein